jgi:hypothetical protein
MSYQELPAGNESVVYKSCAVEIVSSSAVWALYKHCVKFGNLMVVLGGSEGWGCWERARIVTYSSKQGYHWPGVPVLGP